MAKTDSNAGASVAVPVAALNAALYNLSVSVNGGTTFAIPAANPNFVPGLPTSSGPPWNMGGPAPGTLGPGSNELVLQLGTAPATRAILLLPNENPMSVQLYFFFGSSGALGAVDWLALYAGMPVAQGKSSSEAQSDADVPATT